MAILHLNKEDFEKEVLQSDVPVLVDFWASWCGPCKMIAPILEKVDEEIAGEAKIVKVETDECPELAGEYGIMTIPTLVLFKNGQEVNRSVGVRQKNEIIAMIK